MYYALLAKKVPGSGYVDISALVRPSTSPLPWLHYGGSSTAYLDSKDIQTRCSAPAPPCCCMHSTAWGGGCLHARRCTVRSKAMFQSWGCPAEPKAVLSASCEWLHLHAASKSQRTRLG
jgi:hypothetical protein